MPPPKSAVARHEEMKFNWAKSTKIASEDFASKEKQMTEVVERLQGQLSTSETYIKYAIQLQQIKPPNGGSVTDRLVALTAKLETVNSNNG